jgi:hypothetical protein
MSAADLTPTTPIDWSHMKKLKSVRVATHVGAAILAAGLGFTRLPVANAAANAVIVVNALGDSNVCDDTTCTLRGAVERATITPGDDVINFGIDGTITLGSGITLGLPIPGPSASTDSLTISGVGRNVELRGPNSGDWFTTGTQSLTLDSLTIVAIANGGNVNGGFGGAATLNIVNGSGTITNNTITTTANGGSAIGGFGGAATLNIANGGTGTITNNTITTTANGGTANGGLGGAATLNIANGGTGTITNNTITNNTITTTANGGTANGGLGGAATLNIANGGTGTLTNNTITTTANGGTANGSLGGAATLNIVNGGTGTLTNNTITTIANDGAADGGFGGTAMSRLASGTSATLRNNVLQFIGNATCGSVTDSGGNVDSGTSCGFVSPSTSFSNTNAMLGGLAANGGPTQTKALDAASPAIGIGVSPCPAKDQRGKSREASGCDAGAYEVAFTDTTAPTASPKISPKPNDAGWNNTAATVTWNWADETNGSGLKADACALTTAVSATGTNTVSSDCEDQSGNKATKANVTVNIDTTAPTVAITGVTDGASYSSTAVPTALCSTTDATSGVATNATATTTTATDTVTITCTGATDKAGNTQTAAVTATYTLLAPTSTTPATVPPTTAAPATAAPTTAAPVVTPPIVAVIPNTPPTATAAGNAQTPPSPSLNISASAATEGNTVTATAEGFQPGSEVTFELRSDPVTLGKTNADANGRATLTTTLPAGVTGQHNIVAIGINPAGQPVELKSPIVIAPKIESLPQAPIATAAPATETPNTLALTGGNVAAITAAAIAMILVGLSLRRTKTQK